MNTKLTLRLDHRLIESAKRYSAKTGRPVSRIVANLFAIMEQGDAGEKPELSPTVRSLRGVLKGADLDESAYKKHLEEKHL